MAPNLKLLFKEQWWCISTLTTLKGDELKAQVEKLDKYAEDLLSSFELKDINANFVPDENDRKMIIKIAQSVDVVTSWKDFMDDFDFEADGKTYSKLGFMLFRIRIKKEKLAGFNVADIRPSLLQQVVFRVWFKMLKDFKGIFRFDDGTPPYLLTVCAGYSPNSPYIPWTTENIDKYKEEVGQWVEVYSGQFPDYRDELYKARVENNISNRHSEMHMFNRNSALLYLDPDNYNKYFIKDEETPTSTGYLFDTVLMSVIRIRTISYAMIMVNTQIDNDTKNLLNKEYTNKDPGKIKLDLEKTSRLKMQLQNMIAPFFTDLSRSHRQHYTVTLHRAVEMFNIQESFDTIVQKIDSNKSELNEIFLKKQQEAAERQEEILTMVNLILGIGVIFDLLGLIFGENEILALIIPWIAGIALVVLLYGLAKFFVAKLKEGKE
jgi:uncharacterized membrane protein YuzA (DUF378 family)